jgi:hypothetical protein
MPLSEDLLQLARTAAARMDLTPHLGLGVGLRLAELGRTRPAGRPPAAGGGG